MKESQQMANRHLGSRVEFDKNAGPIIEICPLANCVEVYQSDCISRLHSPEALDPDEIDPNMQSVVTKVADVGTRNQIVARLMIQSHNVLSSLAISEELRRSVMQRLSYCREILLICEKIALQVSSEVAAIQILVNESLHANARVINPLPQVADLEDKCYRFLVNSKRFIQLLAEIFNDFFGTTFRGPRFDLIRDWAGKSLGMNSEMYRLVAEIGPDFKYVVELRNHQEHPDDKATVIDNFRLLPHSKIEAPHWYVTGGPPAPIAEDMCRLVKVLLESAEALVILCALYQARIGIPFKVVTIPEEQRQRECPILYGVIPDCP